MERKLAWARLLAWWPAASSVACNARSSGSQSVAGPIRRVIKMILPIALLTCLDGLEPIQSHQNVACDTALVSTILQRTAFDLLCRPRAGANNLANIQHEHLARCGTHGSQLDDRKHHDARLFDATRAGLVSIPGAQGERWIEIVSERWKLRSQVTFCI